MIPVRLGTDWNLITRTIVPITQLSHIQPESVSGLGDIVQSFFLSPTQPIAGLLIGAGPVLLYPTGSDNRISANQWAAGPTLVVLRQAGPWTAGILANHLQGFGGIGHNGQGGQAILAFEDFTTTTQGAKSTRVSTTYLQPFASYTFATRTTISTSAEAAYDWTGRRWVVPVVAGVSQVLKLGGQPFSLGLAGKYTAVQPSGAAAWGICLTFTLLFPT